MKQQQQQQQVFEDERIMNPTKEQNDKLQQAAGTDQKVKRAQPQPQLWLQRRPTHGRGCAKDVERAYKEEAQAWPTT